MNLKLEEFNRQVNIAIPYLQANIDRLIVGDEFLKKLVDALDAWNKAYAITQSPATRTPLAVQDMHEKREILDKLYKEMQQSLKNSTLVTLTADDYAQLFINKDKSKSTNPVPTIGPKFDLVGRNVLGLKIQTSDPSLPNVNYSKLPDGVKSVNIFVAFVNAGAPEPADSDYHLFKTEGRATFDLTFDKEHLQQTVYIKGTFLNNKGQAGPMSLPINVVISD